MIISIWIGGEIIADLQRRKDRAMVLQICLHRLDRPKKAEKEEKEEKKSVDKDVLIRQILEEFMA